MTKQFLKYAVPSALAMFVSSLYVIIDGIFVGQGVGDSALAAVNVIMPFTIMLFGIATMFAVGGGSLVSKYLGKKDKESAVEVLSYNYGAKNKDKMIKFYNMTNIACLIVNIVFSGVCFVFGRDIIGIFTSNLEIIEITYVGLNLFNIGFLLQE